MADATKKDIDVINQFTGEKWYYTDIVKDHFFHPRNLLWERPQNEDEFDAHGMVGSPACILPSTLVQKNPTISSIGEVKTGERVLSHDGYFHSVRRIFQPRYSSHLVKIKNQLGEISATPDHLIYAMSIPRDKTSSFASTRYKKRIPPSWIHAGDLKKGDIVLYPIPKDVQNVEKISLPRETRRKFDFKSRPLSSTLPLNEEVLELFGYFVAEGHTKRDGQEIGFTFGEKEMEYAVKVRDLVKKYFGLAASLRIRPENHRIDVAVYNIYLARLFPQWFGNSAETKRVPYFLMFLDPAIQAGFIRGVWRGDGYFSKNRSQPRAGFVTVSETLLHQLKWFLLRQRIIPSVYREKEKMRGGVHHQISYRVHVGQMDSLERLAGILEIPFVRDPAKWHIQEMWHDENYIYLPVRKVKRVSSTGRLSNFEVNDSHTYATDAFLVHNCGDMMEMWAKVDRETERIKDLKWKTFGCASAISATSMFSVMVTENEGMRINDALKVRPQDVMKRLGGLPNRKIHCSVLADKAFQKTANDYFRRTEQHHRIVIEGARVVDSRLNVTDKDIEEAVLEGATTLEDVQKKLKVGVGASEEVKTEVEQLIRFYAEKYYG